MMNKYTEDGRIIMEPEFGVEMLIEGEWYRVIRGFSTAAKAFDYIHHTTWPRQRRVVQIMETRTVVERVP